MFCLLLDLICSLCGIEKYPKLHEHSEHNEHDKQSSKKDEKIQIHENNIKHNFGYYIGQESILME